MIDKSKINNTHLPLGCMPQFKMLEQKCYCFWLPQTLCKLYTLTFFSACCHVDLTFSEEEGASVLTTGPQKRGSGGPTINT